MKIIKIEGCGSCSYCRDAYQVEDGLYIYCDKLHKGIIDLDIDEDCPLEDHEDKQNLDNISLKIKYDKLGVELFIGNGGKEHKIASGGIDGTISGGEISTPLKDLYDNVVKDVIKGKYTPNLTNEHL